MSENYSLSVLLSMEDIEENLHYGTLKYESESQRVYLKYNNDGYYIVTHEKYISEHGWTFDRQYILS